MNISNTNRRSGMLVIWPLSNPQWSLCTFHIFLTLYCFLDPSTTHNWSKVTVFKKNRKNTMKYNSTKLRVRLWLIKTELERNRDWGRDHIMLNTSHCNLNGTGITHRDYLSCPISSPFHHVRCRTLAMRPHWRSRSIWGCNPFWSALAWYTRKSLHHWSELYRRASQHVADVQCK